MFQVWPSSHDTACDEELSSLHDIFDDTDDNFLNSILTNSLHVLHRFTKPKYNFRHRTHQKKWIPKSVNLNDQEFFCLHVVRWFLPTSTYIHVFYVILFYICYSQFSFIILLSILTDAHVNWLLNEYVCMYVCMYICQRPASIAFFAQICGLSDSLPRTVYYTLLIAHAEHIRLYWWWTCVLYLFFSFFLRNTVYSQHVSKLRTFPHLNTYTHRWSTKLFPLRTIDSKIGLTQATSSAA